MKKGISLVMLSIIIVVIAILSSIAVISMSSATNSSRVANFYSNMNTIESAVQAYYAINGTLPLNNSTAISKAELLSLAGNASNELNEEIIANLDNDSVFYYVDISKLNLENMVLDITATSNDLVVNNTCSHVYYVKGFKVGENIYFSVQKTIK